MCIFIEVECSLKIKTTFPSHCVIGEVVSVSTIQIPSDVCLNHRMLLVPEAGAGVYIFKILGPIRTANEGDAVFSGRLKYMDANKLGPGALDNNKDQGLSAKVISFLT